MFLFNFLIYSKKVANALLTTSIVFLLSTLLFLITKGITTLLNIPIEATRFLSIPFIFLITTFAIFQLMQEKEGKHQFEVDAEKVIFLASITFVFLLFTSNEATFNFAMRFSVINTFLIAGCLSYFYQRSFATLIKNVVFEQGEFPEKIDYNEPYISNELVAEKIHASFKKEYKKKLITRVEDEQDKEAIINVIHKGKERRIAFTISTRISGNNGYIILS